MARQVIGHSLRLRFSRRARLAAGIYLGCETDHYVIQLTPTRLEVQPPPGLVPATGWGPKIGTDAPNIEN